MRRLAEVKGFDPNNFKLRNIATRYWGEMAPTLLVDEVNKVRAALENTNASGGRVGDVLKLYRPKRPWPEGPSAIYTPADLYKRYPNRKDHWVGLRIIRTEPDSGIASVAETFVGVRHYILVGG
jgi:hypothetical protein